MKKILALTLLMLLGGIAALAWSFSAAKLDTSQVQSQFTPATAKPPAGMQVSAILAGHMLSQQLFSWRGGDVSAAYISGMTAILVEHPQGDFLVDTGFGKNVDDHFLTIPWLMQQTTSYEPGTPVITQLKKANYDLSKLQGIFLTHLHWDHVSGLPDFPGLPVKLAKSELAFLHSGDESGVLLRSFAEQNYQTYEFSDQPYENFERSLDIYGDGAVVLVPLPGHTPGSTGIFLNLPSGKRYFLVGDLVWASEGIEIPAERPWLARQLADHDEAGVRETIVRVHQLTKKHPQLIIVPAHDRRVHERMSVFPQRES